MVFRPLTCRTRWEGVAVTVWLILIDLLLLIWMWRRPIDWMKFGLIVLMVAQRAAHPALGLSHVGRVHAGILGRSKLNYGALGELASGDPIVQCASA